MPVGACRQILIGLNYMIFLLTSLELVISYGKIGKDYFYRFCQDGLGGHLILYSTWKTTYWVSIMDRKENKKIDLEKTEYDDTFSCIIPHFFYFTEKSTIKVLIKKRLWPWRDSNPRPSEPESDVLYSWTTGPFWPQKYTFLLKYTTIFRSCLNFISSLFERGF